MACNHPEIMSKNCVLYCLKCGAELPRDFKVTKDTPKAEKPANGPKRAAKRTAKKKGE